MGIELKTKAEGSLQTLFSRTPCRYVEDMDKTSMFRRHSYFDKKRNRRALYTSFNNQPDSLGFRLMVQDKVVHVVRGRRHILEYDAEEIEAALLSKHTQSAYLSLKPGREKGKATCTLVEVQFCKWPSIIRFIRLLESGDVFLNFTMAANGQGSIKDHGFLWRIRTDALERLYLSSKVFDPQTRPQPAPMIPKVQMPQR